MSKYLSVKNLEKIYYSKKDEIQAIKNISFDLDEGEFIAIIGPSGCGKSTLLNIITDMDKKTKGEIIRKDNLKFGYMLQSEALLEWRNIWDNVCLGLEIKKEKTKENLEYVEHLIKTYGLEEFRYKYPRELSGGMKQRVG